MFEIFVAVAMMVVSYAITAAMTPKTSISKGQLDIPVAEDGTNLRVVFGTVLIKDPNLVWYGDSRTSAIYSDSGKK